MRGEFAAIARERGVGGRFALIRPSRSLGRLPPEGKASYSTNKGGSHLAVSTEKIYDAGQQYAAVCHLQLQLQAAQLLHPPVSELRARLAGRYGRVQPFAAGHKPADPGGQPWRGLCGHPVRAGQSDQQIQRLCQRRGDYRAGLCGAAAGHAAGAAHPQRCGVPGLFVPLRAGQLYENAVYPVHPLADAEPAGRHRRCADHAEPAALLPAVPERLKNGRYRFFAGKCAGRFDIHGVCVHCGRVLAVLQAQGV